MSPLRPSKGHASKPSASGDIRGKISSPIPFAPGEEEFPQRDPGTGIAIPLQNENMDSRLKVIPPPIVLGDDDSPGGPPPLPMSMFVSPSCTTAPVEYLDEEEQEEQETTAERPLTEFIAPGLDPAVAPSDTIIIQKQSAPPPQRRKSTFRSALSRIFGKKNKRSSSGSVAPASNTQHRSAPAAFKDIAKEPPTIVPRSASMPVDQYNRALRSHLPQTELETKPPDIVLETPVIARPNRPRGATTGRINVNNSGHQEWGLRPRPASNRAKSASPLNDGNGIGTAVTIDSRPHRRSRSLSHMGHRAYSDHTQKRRRSDEIKYWRESYDPTPSTPLSSGKDIESPFPDNEPFNNTTEELPVPLPPQPFNFGQLGEMAGMKITEKATLETRMSKIEDQMKTLEQRLTTLRARASSNILRLQDAPSIPTTETLDSTRPVTPERHPRRTMYQQTHNPQADTAYTPVTNESQISDSRPTTSDTVKTDSSTDPSPELKSPPVKQPSRISLQPVRHFSRPSSTQQSPRFSTSAIPPFQPRDSKITKPPSPEKDQPKQAQQFSQSLKASSSSKKHHRISIEHYENLVQLVKSERDSRQRLEDVVFALQSQLQAVIMGKVRMDPYVRGDDEYNHSVQGGEGVGLDGMPLTPTYPPSGRNSGMGRIEGLTEDESGRRDDDVVTEGGGEGSIFGDEDFRTPSEDKGYSEGGSGFPGQDSCAGFKGRTMSVGQMTKGKALYNEF